MHFDVACSDPAAEQQRVEALGGRRLEEYADELLVMADPEGNEFCIIPEGSGSVGVDDQGHTHSFG